MANKDDALLKELQQIKLLLILQLVRAGAKQAHIANALGISERTLGRMLPATAAKKSATGDEAVA